MSNYAKVTNFLSKDSLSSGNPLKLLKGAEFDTEFTAIQTAVNSKYDGSSTAITLSGTLTASALVGGTLSATTGTFSGAVSAAGNLSGGFGTLASPTTYGSVSVSGATAGFAGIQFTGTTGNRTFMVGTGATPQTGMYNVTGAAWDWYFTGSTLTQGTVPGANVSGAVASATTAAACSGNAATATTANNVAMSAQTGSTPNDLAVATSITTIAYSGGATLTATGALSATTVSATSDIRLKKDITLITDALYKVMKLNGVNFKWKETGDASTGLLAQDVIKVMPSAVTKGKEYMSVNYGGLVGLLVEAIKELDAKVEALSK